MNAREKTLMDEAIEELEFSEQRAGTKRTTLSDLLEIEFAPINFLNKPFIAEGLTILAGRPKIGKTTLLRQLLVSLSDGGDFLGGRCEPCDSLFLCLEEGERMAQNKFKTIANGRNCDRIDMKFEWPRGVEGVWELRQYMDNFPNTRFIAIDSLSRFRNPDDKSMPQFQQDYEIVMQLHTLTKDFPQLCIVILHHTKKMKTDDPIDAISGTYGITAACDSYGVLLKDANKFRLHWGGRNWELENSDFELTREGGIWTNAGEYDMTVAGLTPVQQRVVEILKEEGVVTTSGMARRLDVTTPTAREHLATLVGLGVIKRSGNDYSVGE